MGTRKLDSRRCGFGIQCTGYRRSAYFYQPERGQENRIAGVPLGTQVVWLFVLAIPVACVAWTVTHEEVFREPREYCLRQADVCAHWYQRKFFYLFTCEYCFSHYVVIVFLALTRYKLLYQDWRGYIIAGFALVFVANLYTSLYSNLRLDIKRERTQIKAIEKEVKEKDKPRLEKPAA